MDANARRVLTPDAEQVILGSLLGDGGLERPPQVNSQWGLSIKHGLPQTEYCLWKAGLLGDLVRTVDYPVQRVRVRTVRHPCFTDLASRWYPVRRKVVPAADLDLMGPLALGVWYLDDGTLTQPRRRKTGYYDREMVRFATHAFVPAEQDLLHALLRQRFGVVTTRATWRNPRDPEHPYEGIRLYGDNVAPLLDYIRPAVSAVTSMAYKLVVRPVDNP